MITARRSMEEHVGLYRLAGGCKKLQRLPREEEQKLRC
jgi:hypothetical protein